MVTIRDIKILDNRPNYVVLVVGHRLLCYSYNILVAVYHAVTKDAAISDGNVLGVQKKWSKTTNKHIDTFCNDAGIDREEKTYEHRLFIEWCEKQGIES